MLNCLAVALGGAIGSVLRYLIGLIPVKEQFLFPIKTFAINVIGCFVIGLVTALTLKSNNLNPKLVLFMKVGICGGFTTFNLRPGKFKPLEKRTYRNCSFVYVPQHCCRNQFCSACRTYNKKIKTRGGSARSGLKKLTKSFNLVTFNQNNA